MIRPLRFQELEDLINELSGNRPSYCTWDIDVDSEKCECQHCKILAGLMQLESIRNPNQGECEDDDPPPCPIDGPHICDRAAHST